MPTLMRISPKNPLGAELSRRTRGCHRRGGVGTAGGPSVQSDHGQCGACNFGSNRWAVVSDRQPSIENAIGDVYKPPPKPWRVRGQANGRVTRGGP
jgi:hypothetical protein